MLEFCKNISYAATESINKMSDCSQVCACARVCICGVPMWADRQTCIAKADVQGARLLGVKSGFLFALPSTPPRRGYGGGGDGELIDCFGHSTGGGG